MKTISDPIRLYSATLYRFRRYFYKRVGESWSKYFDRLSKWVEEIKTYDPKKIKELDKKFDTVTDIKELDDENIF